MTELPQYRKIVLATGGSEQAGLAVRHGVALARQTGATLKVLCVLNTHLAFTLGIHQDEALHELRRDGARALTAVDELAGSIGIEVQTDLREGHPGRVIVREAEQWGADLIVLGSHGQGALADILLGSVSHYVVHHAYVPVCVVRPPGR